MKFEREYYVGIKDIGLDGKMSNYGMLSILEEIASSHSDTVGYGVNDIDKRKKVWLLMDWKLQILERANYESKIKVKTWARQITKRPFSTYRDFEVYDEQGNVIALASSKWVLLDIEKGKIVKITPELIGKYKPELTKTAFEDEQFEKIEEPYEYLLEKEYTVRRSDIDVNMHMHNLNYIELANEVLPE